MKSKWIEKEFKYDGSQLQSLFAYLNHNVLGDSIVSWAGACDVTFDHMVDGEDLLKKALIQSDKMLHFLIEIFDEKLITGVAIQRLLSTIVRDIILEYTPSAKIIRDGDDLYWENKKLNVSIATSSPRSVMIHLGVNITNDSTPVPTCALIDFKIPHVEFAKSVMESFCAEYESIKTATQKVKWVK